jgi:hypothetical protein
MIIVRHSCVGARNSPPISVSAPFPIRLSRTARAAKVGPLCDAKKTVERIVEAL